LDWGLCLAGYGTGAVMAVLRRRKRLCFANFFKGQTECQKSRIFLPMIFPEAAYGSKDNLLFNFLNGLDYKEGPRK
jgi:hypothetical protein